MIDINLLPRRRRHANERRRAVRRWIAGGMLWCAVIAVGQAIAVSSGAAADLDPLERELATLAEERTRLDGEIAAARQSITRDTTSLAAARAVVDHPDWSALLARVVGCRPEGVHFRRWHLAPGGSLAPVAGASSAGGGSLALRIEGDAPTLGALTDFALRLEELRLFRAVKILSAQAGPGEDAQARSVGFSIEATLIAPAPATGTPATKGGAA